MSNSHQQIHENQLPDKGSLQMVAPDALLKDAPLGLSRKTGRLGNDF
jgi:hypothetical protein